MAKEIERKFLVKSDEWEQYVRQKIEIEQGYLAKDKLSKNVVRVRITTLPVCGTSNGYLTVKGKRVGITKPEYEFEIPIKEAKELLKMCKDPVIRKIRHLVRVGLDNRFFTFEIDKFTAGPNKGFVLAEIELQKESERFPKPEWLGEDVSHDDRYSNSYLASHKAPRRKKR